MLKYAMKKVVELDAWDRLVEETYGRKYSFQQQNGCQDRGTYDIEVPCDFYEEDYVGDVPANRKTNDMCVSFSKWLERSPDEPLEDQEYDFELHLWWERQFYPPIEAVANDLYKRGLIEAGKYTININW